MYLLQTYGQNKPHFNNNAHTILSIYHDSTLKMFTSHPLKSAALDQPEYYMTQLGSFSLTHDVDVLRQGATWYRNGRDWAKEQRDDAIRRANKQSTNVQIESTSVNASFSIICETSNNKESFTQQTHFSFSDTLATETDESLWLTAIYLEQSTQSRGKRRVAHGVGDIGIRPSTPPLSGYIESPLWLQVPCQQDWSAGKCRDF
jgi:hypothetical protein